MGDPKYYGQDEPGAGITPRYGPRPPYPDDVAERHTPEWLAAWHKMDDWRQLQLMAGATYYDMGMRPEKEHQLPAFLSLAEKGPGSINSPRMDWIKAGNAQGRGRYNQYTGEFSMFQAPRAGTQKDTSSDATAPDEAPFNEGTIGSYSQQVAPDWGGWGSVYNPTATPVPTPSTTTAQSYKPTMTSTESAQVKKQYPPAIGGF